MYGNLPRKPSEASLPSMPCPHDDDGPSCGNDLSGLIPQDSSLVVSVEKQDCMGVESEDGSIGSLSVEHDTPCSQSTPLSRPISIESEGCMDRERGDGRIASLTVEHDTPFSHSRPLSRSMFIGSEGCMNGEREDGRIGSLSVEQDE